MGRSSQGYADRNKSLRKRIVRVLQRAMNSKTRTLFGSRVRDFESVFRAIDKNSDGTVSHEEFSNGMQRLGLRLGTDDLNKLYALLDRDDSGSVDYEEFFICMTQLGAKSAKKNRRKERKEQRMEAAAVEARASSTSLGPSPSNVTGYSDDSLHEDMPQDQEEEELIMRAIRDAIDALKTVGEFGLHRRFEQPLRHLHQACGVFMNSATPLLSLSRVPAHLVHTRLTTTLLPEVARSGRKTRSPAPMKRKKNGNSNSSNSNSNSRDINNNNNNNHNNNNTSTNWKAHYEGLKPDEAKGTDGRYAGSMSSYITKKSNISSQMKSNGRRESDDMRRLDFTSLPRIEDHRRPAVSPVSIIDNSDEDSGWGSDSDSDVMPPIVVKRKPKPTVSMAERKRRWAEAERKNKEQQYRQEQWRQRIQQMQDKW